MRNSCKSPRRSSPRRSAGQVYGGRRELIDHVLCSHALIDAVRGATTGGLPVESIEDPPDSRRDATASDHRPVLVDIAAA
jgi:hypothetical protein